MSFIASEIVVVNQTSSFMIYFSARDYVDGLFSLIFLASVAWQRLLWSVHGTISMMMIHESKEMNGNEKRSNGRVRWEGPYTLD